MEVWWKIRGWVRLRMTSADCPGRLRELSQQMRMEDIHFPDDLTSEFTISIGDRRRITLRDGDNLEQMDAGGMPIWMEAIRRWWMVAGFVLVLLGLTMFLRGRVLFLRVEGNARVPERLILEQAAECGLSFGARSSDIRSEQVKNHLLRAVPQLRWAGVNVDGCSAVISVAERHSGETPVKTVPGDVVSTMDAVVTDVLPGVGSLLCAPGQAVRAGDVLISGASDLGRLIRYDRAEGEVYGLTRRVLEVKLPVNGTIRGENGRLIRKFSLRIGKKYVNFSNDSGILHGTCVKMRTVKDLKLPGGFVLPVALVTETYRLCDTESVSREMDAEMLLSEARRFVREDMIAGTILREEVTAHGDRLLVLFECREMIGVFRPGIEIEGDTNDRENSERGTG